MPALDLIAPALLLLAIALAHLGYFALHRGADGQHHVELTPGPGPDSDIGPARGQTQAVTRSSDGVVQQLRGSYAIVRQGRRPWGSHTPAPQVPVESRRARRYAVAGLRLRDRALADPLICADDLVVEGLTTFTGPVKVAGDLVVTGRAVFSQPVTVNGYVHVLGEAVFYRGLIAKSDTVVSGNLVLGARGLSAWMVARKLLIEGGFALNGEVAAVDGVHLPEAA